jgi:hypothetical protein
MTYIVFTQRGPSWGRHRFETSEFEDLDEARAGQGKAFFCRATAIYQKDGKKLSIWGTPTAKTNTERHALEYFLQQERSKKKKTSGDGKRNNSDPDHIPDYLLCNISFDLLVDPVTTKSGYTYSRANIERQIRLRGTDPFTRERLTVEDLIPNRSLADAVEQFRKEHCFDALDLSDDSPIPSPLPDLVRQPSLFTPDLFAPPEFNNLDGNVLLAL